MVSVMTPEDLMIFEDNPERVYQDDEFRISLWELMYRHKPKTFQEVQKVLDDNGYHGRSKVIQVSEKGKLTTKIKISVYLAETKIEYRWPLGNTYDMATNKLFKKPKFNKPQRWYGRIRRIMDAFFTWGLSRPGDIEDKIIALRIATQIDYSHCYKAFMILLKAELLDGNYN